MHRTPSHVYQSVFTICIHHRDLANNWGWRRKAKCKIISTAQNQGQARCLTTQSSVYQGDEWEEKWGEKYTASGAVTTWADKWAKDGPNVWHERWGEDYDSSGGSVKYTDKVLLTTCC